MSILAALTLLLLRSIFLSFVFLFDRLAGVPPHRLSSQHLADRASPNPTTGYLGLLLLLPSFLQVSGAWERMVCFFFCEEKILSKSEVYVSLHVFWFIYLRIDKYPCKRNPFQCITTYLSIYIYPSTCISSPTRHSPFFFFFKWCYCFPFFPLFELLFFVSIYIYVFFSFETMGFVLWSSRWRHRGI